VVSTFFFQQPGERVMPTELHSASTLIGSDRVQGTSVFDADGQKIGVIECVMIEKVSGRVSFAVMSSGGFLGIGDTRHPLPWPALKYNPELGGYQIMIPANRLKETLDGQMDGELAPEQAAAIRDYCVADSQG
jgi:hypothetical protein